MHMYVHSLLVPLDTYICMEFWDLLVLLLQILLVCTHTYTIRLYVLMYLYQLSSVNDVCIVSVCTHVRMWFYVRCSLDT